MTKKCFIVFPNQLFKETIYADSDFQIFLVEEDLFFKQYNFHKQKILFHRSSMKFYQEYLLKKGFNVQYVNSYDNESDIIELIRKINNLNYTKIEIYDPVDYLLLRRIKRITSELKIDLVIHDSKLFINSSFNSLILLNRCGSKIAINLFLVIFFKAFNVILISLG